MDNKDCDICHDAHPNGGLHLKCARCYQWVCPNQLDDNYTHHYVVENGETCGPVFYQSQPEADQASTD